MQGAVLCPFFPRDLCLDYWRPKCMVEVLVEGILFRVIVF